MKLVFSLQLLQMLLTGLSDGICWSRLILSAAHVQTSLWEVLLQFLVLLLQQVVQVELHVLHPHSVTAVNLVNTLANLFSILTNTNSSPLCKGGLTWKAGVYSVSPCVRNSWQISSFALTQPLPCFLPSRPHSHCHGNEGLKVQRGSSPSHCLVHVDVSPAFRSSVPVAPAV